MVQLKAFGLLALSLSKLSEARLLLDYNAARNDDVSKMGQLDLEGEGGNRVSSNRQDLYAKGGNDWRGEKCAHFHKEEGTTRAEYHSIPSQTKGGQSYWIGYEFAVGHNGNGKTPQDLWLWQWQNFDDQGNDAPRYPLSLGVKNGRLSFDYSDKKSDGRQSQWSTPIRFEIKITITIQIVAKKRGEGYAKIWYNKQPVRFNGGSDKFEGNVFPGRCEPKFGIYGAKGQEADVWAYNVQVGESKNDLDHRFV